MYYQEEADKKEPFKTAKVCFGNKGRRRRAPGQAPRERHSPLEIPGEIYAGGASKGRDVHGRLLGKARGEPFGDRENRLSRARRHSARSGHEGGEGQGAKAGLSWLHAVKRHKVG